MSRFSPAAQAGFRRAGEAARVKPWPAGALAAVLALAALCGCGGGSRTAGPRAPAGALASGSPADPLAQTVPGHIPPTLDPYNMYFTPDGRYAIIVAEAHRELDFRYAHTMALHHALAVPQCAGVDHMDFTADGRYALASCEFSGRTIVVDLARETVVKTIELAPGAMPQESSSRPTGAPSTSPTWPTTACGS